MERWNGVVSRSPISPARVSMCGLRRRAGRARKYYVPPRRDELCRQQLRARRFRNRRRLRNSAAWARRSRHRHLQFPISSTVVAARDADMKRATKSLIVLLCASLCAGGTMLSLKERASDYRHKTKVARTKTRQPKRAGGILVKVKGRPPDR